MGDRYRCRRSGPSVRSPIAVGRIDQILSIVGLATEIYLSPRTAEHHVSHILTELEASTRRDGGPGGEAGSSVAELAAPAAVYDLVAGHGAGALQQPGPPTAGS